MVTVAYIEPSMLLALPAYRSPLVKKPPSKLSLVDKWRVGRRKPVLAECSGCVHRAATAAGEVVCWQLFRVV
jgi:hypothetical protein